MRYSIGEGSTVQYSTDQNITVHYTTQQHTTVERRRTFDSICKFEDFWCHLRRVWQIYDSSRFFASIPTLWGNSYVDFLAVQYTCSTEYYRVDGGIKLLHRS